MIEVIEYRKAVLAWLAGITGMSALVGDRLYYIGPQGVVGFPWLGLSLSRTPWPGIEGYPGGHWQGVCTINVYALDVNTADAIEDLIWEDMGDNAQDPLTTRLSVAGKVTVQDFALVEVDEDNPVEHPTEGGFVCWVRPLRFRTAFVATLEG